MNTMTFLSSPSFELQSFSQSYIHMLAKVSSSPYSAIPDLPLEGSLPNPKKMPWA